MESTDLQKLSGKNWMATLFACWGLGMFGAHRFYTGKQVTAWIMLVCTLVGVLAPVSAIWAAIDGVFIALGKFTHEDGSELYERIDWVGYVYLGLLILSVLAVVGYLLVMLFALSAIMGLAGGAAGSAIAP